MTIPVEYDPAGRMKYHPDYHARHGKPWLVSEERYLIEQYEAMGPEAVSLALERTVGVVMTRVYELRKAGKMPPRSANAKSHKRTRAGL